MIKSIRFANIDNKKKNPGKETDRKNGRDKFYYAKNIPFLKPLYEQKSELEFKPGINILFGSNGSGKSTVLNLMANYLAAEQGGVSCVTHYWLSDNQLLEVAPDYHLVHDGKPILYANPRNIVGLMGKDIDEDFFDDGLVNLMDSKSTGELSNIRTSKAIGTILNQREHPKDIEWRVEKESSNPGDKSSMRIKAVEKQLMRHDAFAGETNTPNTILMDEPESGYSLPRQKIFWERIIKPVNPEKFQLIIATHSPFALGIPGAHYIEMETGYIKESIACLKDTFGN